MTDNIDKLVREKRDALRRADDEAKIEAENARNRAVKVRVESEVAATRCEPSVHSAIQRLLVVAKPNGVQGEDWRHNWPGQGGWHIYTNESDSPSRWKILASGEWLRFDVAEVRRFSDNEGCLVSEPVYRPRVALSPVTEAPLWVECADDIVGVRDTIIATVADHIVDLEEAVDRGLVDRLNHARRIVDQFAKQQRATIERSSSTKWRLEKQPLRLIGGNGVYYWTAELDDDGHVRFSERQWESHSRSSDYL